MNLFSYNPASRLDEDVLLAIFDHLDDQDLLRCETVCILWRNVLLSGRPWRRLFHRKIVSSPQFREVCWDLGVDETKLETVHYRELCKAIIQEVNNLDGNWRTGNCEKRTKDLNFYWSAKHIIIGKNCIARYGKRDDYPLEEQLWHDKMEVRFLHRTNLEVQSCINLPDGSLAATNAEIVVVWDKENMKILDTDGQLISEIPELSEDERVSLNLASCCISGDQMAVISQNDGQEKLSLWDVKDPSKPILLKSRRFNLNMKLKMEMKMDQQFVAISTFENKTTSFYFFSKETLDLHWQKTADEVAMCNFAYDQGMLPISVVNGGFGLEMYDVASRMCFRKMRRGKRNYYEHVDLNSKFMIVVEGWYNPPFKVNIYDLEAIKNPKSTEDELLVRTFDVKMTDYIRSNVTMNETEFLISGSSEMIIFKFGSLLSLRNAAKPVTLSLPWRSVWRSKGVDEEPLEPARHIEVYKEVLEYFHQLDMNCQTAIKCYAIDDLETSLTLGDGYIGYRQRNQKMIVYDEHMDRRSYEVGSNSVLISKTTHVSVMGKTILLVDSSTGKVTKETKLERYADEWHFNCNLLVCVHKIADHEHLLSVWRIN